MENFFEKKKDGRWKTFLKKKDGRWKTFLKKKTDRWKTRKTFSKTKMTDGKVFDQWGEKKKTVRESKIAI